MYLEHFGLREFPFRITPDPSFLFWTADHHHAFDLLTQVARGEKPVAIILGEPGTGKTTLLRHFIALPQKDTHVGIISNYRSGMGGLATWLNSAFGLPLADPNEKFGTSFVAHLLARHHDGVPCILILDEVQNVSDEDIVALTDLTRLSPRPGASLRLVIAGQPQPGRRFSTTYEPAGADALLQIGPMSREDVVGYVNHRMAISGCQVSVFEEAAIGQIARSAAGVPRVVNVLCDLLLSLAFGAGERKIDLEFVTRTLHEARQSGILDHLTIGPDGPASEAEAARMPVGATTWTPPTIPEQKTAGPCSPTGRVARPATLQITPRIEARPTLASTSALPVVAHDITEAAIAADKPHRHRTALAYVAAAAASLALALLPSQVNAPGPTGTMLHPGDARGNAAKTANAPGSVYIGPALPIPTPLHGIDANTLKHQALSIGEQEPRTAAIGFARAALRGDARAAYFLGQHFEVGDGVPRNTALAADWYASAAETQRGAHLALQNMTETLNANGEAYFARPRPLMGIIGSDRVAEFIWAVPGERSMGYLVELSHAPDAEPQQYGPFDLSAALLNAEAARLWRVVSLGPEGSRLAESDWHLIDVPSTIPVTP